MFVLLTEQELESSSKGWLGNIIRRALANLTLKVNNLVFKYEGSVRIPRQNTARFRFEVAHDLASLLFPFRAREDRKIWGGWN